MTQTSNRFYDQFARLMNDAASVAQGVRREAEGLFRSRAERFVNGMELVRREDFDAVREQAARAREENARLEARIAELEAKLMQPDIEVPGTTTTTTPKARPARKPAAAAGTGTTAAGAARAAPRTRSRAKPATPSDDQGGA